jgi:arginyl-tRNA--protein-N-Asp/Glu arginylyltransferase
MHSLVERINLLRRLRRRNTSTVGTLFFTTPTNENIYAGMAKKFQLRLQTLVRVQCAHSQFANTVIRLPQHFVLNSQNRQINAHESSLLNSFVTTPPNNGQFSLQMTV